MKVISIWECAAVPLPRQKCDALTIMTANPFLKSEKLVKRKNQLQE